MDSLIKVKATFKVKKKKKDHALPANILKICKESLFDYPFFQLNKEAWENKMSLNYR